MAVQRTPYGIEDFPIVTTEPEIDVTLPVGVHELELVVEDDAGLVSEPDRVTITVEAEQEVGRIDGITPNVGVRGWNVDAVISGVGLQGATAVTFYPVGSGVLPKLTAEIGDASEDYQLKIRIAIPADEPSQSLLFRVTTADGGQIESGEVGFTVVDPTWPPAIEGIIPNVGARGQTLDAVISGAGFRDATAVTFSPVGSGVLPKLTAEIGDASEDYQLKIRIVIPADDFSQSLQFRVTTADGGQIESGEVDFTVVDAAKIDAIEPQTGPRGATLDADIRGQGLHGVTAVTFPPGSGVTAGVSDAWNDGRTDISLQIDGQAPTEAFPFRVTTPRGEIESGSVRFTVIEQEVGWIHSIEPSSGAQGAGVGAVIRGEGLDDATAVTFPRESGMEAAVVAATQGALEIMIRIHPQSPTEAFPFSVTTPRGEIESGEVRFIVEPGEEGGWIHSIDPDLGELGGTVDAEIEGEGLKDATAVGFRTLGFGVMPRLTAEVRDARKDDRLKIRITIPESEFPQEFGFAVTVANGGELPSGDVHFTVVDAIRRFRGLTDVRGIGPTYAGRLEGAGITSAKDLASAEPAGLAATLKVSKDRARLLIHEANRLLDS